MLQNGPPAIPPHGECSGAERVRSLQDTLSAFSVSHGIEGEGALMSMTSWREEMCTFPQKHNRASRSLLRQVFGTFCFVLLDLESVTMKAPKHFTMSQCPLSLAVYTFLVRGLWLPTCFPRGSTLSDFYFSCSLASTIHIATIHASDFL